MSTMGRPGAEGEVRILGVRVDNVREEETLSRIEAFVGEGRPRQVVTVNPEFVVMAQWDREFRDILNGADLALPDGVGLLWASKLLGNPLKERVAGSDLVEQLAARASRLGYSLYLLGAMPGVGDQAARALQRRHPGLRIAGTYPGSPDPTEDEEIVCRVRAASPDILLVAYGAPTQDRWIRRNLERLGVPVSIGVGGALDFVSGTVKRAPPLVRRLGLEWLYRLTIEPWRWRRMLRLPRFAFLVLRSRLWQSR